MQTLPRVSASLTVKPAYERPVSLTSFISQTSKGAEQHEFIDVIAVQINVNAGNSLTRLLQIRKTVLRLAQILNEFAGQLWIEGATNWINGERCDEFVEFVEFGRRPGLPAVLLRDGCSC